MTQSAAPHALTGAAIFDGTVLHEHHALLATPQGPRIVALADLPAETPRRDLGGGTILPAFVDLQANGGGGVMFNAAPNVETLRRMAAAHAGTGTGTLLPTLITDTAAQTSAAIEAVAAALAEGVPEIAGLHLEGPHLSVARKGAHDAGLVRPMEARDLRLLLDAAERLPNLMVTVAPESVSPAQIAELAAAGVIVSLGHSDTDYDSAMRALDAGARCVTHLFNAMSQLGSRTPGLVGAALDHGGASAGLIADGIHVHPATIRAALAAKRGPGDVFLVTDAMACAGSDITEFTLNGRRITRRAGRLTLADGTLAGADLEMPGALKVMIQDVGDAPARAFARATSIPAGLLREPRGAGGWPETLAGLVHLDAALSNPTRCDRL